MTRLFLFGLLFLAAASPAATAAELVVNGDTPARRWQRVVDRSAMPAFPGPAVLYLRDPAGGQLGTAELVAAESGPEVEITVQVAGRSTSGITFTLRHEVGHVTLWWLRATGAWAAPQDQAVARLLGVTAAVSESGRAAVPAGRDPVELVPDAYAICASRDGADRRFDLSARKLEAAAVGEPYRLRSIEQVVAICGMVERAAHRARASAAADWRGELLRRVLVGEL